ncbi:MAG TPA: UDP-N-acetylmuramoyl-L-alanyl-D-glutamate--2,6-diaminopimelate ligase [Bacteroidales bacterium]|nr:UDP-N-acetylmuramoyl-L-alanyl-D-glutamate--2,6-diaminopimelate ligase [Bacteroidales bacterium]
MNKNLGILLNNIDVLRFFGETDITVSGITFDSRKTERDTLFVAVKGSQTDGHDYIEKAIESGARAIICEQLPAKLNPEITFIQVPDSAKALSVAASSFYDNPSCKLKLVGITGTNGKTTTITLLHRLFTLLGYKTGCFTTIRNYIGDRTVEATHTTPDPVQLNRIMNDMVEEGCQYAFMEVSSHSLHQKRVAGLTYTGGIFSNITHDHLDYHKTFDEYIKAKKIFFDTMPAGSFSLINADDKNGRVMVQNTKSSVYYYALRSMADYKARIIESHFNGTLLQIDNTELWTKFLGEFNAYNLLAVYACAMLLGQNKEEVLRLLSNMDTVEGRFQYLRSEEGITAVIDYAHTPDAIVNVLRTISQIRKKEEKVITVVGAGGNRDKTKRPVMAKVAAEMSDKVILTSDNPRNEEPLDILNDMKAGLDKEMLSKTVIQPDRREAIKMAVMLAHPGDIILIAGKGHETYQEIKGVKHHFSDFEEVESIFGLKTKQE